MPTTPTYGFPYPALSDTPNGPTQIGNLATQMESILTGTFVAADNALGARLLNIGAATVATNESLNTGSYTDLTTVGPTVTLTTRTIAIAFWASQIFSTGTFSGRVGCEVSGATTIAAASTSALITTFANTNDAFRCGMIEVFNLTAGSNTFRLKYSSAGGSVNFQNRRLIVWAP